MHLKPIKKLIFIIILLLTNLTYAKTGNEFTSCSKFNSMGLAKNSNEFSKTKFTNKQYEVSIPIISSYISSLATGTYGSAEKEAILIMKNSEQIKYVTSNTLSMSRHDCLIDDNNVLEQLIKKNFNKTFLETIKKKSQEIKAEFLKINKKLPIVVDKATNLVKIKVENNASIVYQYKMKNVASHSASESGITSFNEGMKKQLKNDVCNGNSVQSDVRGFTVLYNYYFNDMKLIGSFNLRNIKLKNCPW